ncbi:exodeoxyribonuclease III [Lysobacter auxotrophicus]|uniref:Exodeoxyribonuclease III n=1 Tax=Lysobacter auxotrophicus TaxID=2992573 RepID=A0ABM8DCK2_9GAMM|nr:exodeoxyribonuclease III [Lysobacter auxotrophicus]BDU16323.1 exodeoxyribonuclease III [Lysobacter auxotrophicus]
MKIATFNINGVNTRLPALLEWLRREQPDVACLQELKAPEDAFPAQAIAEAGYGAIWHGQKSWNGVAILARDAEPVEIGRGLPGDPEDLQSRYIEAAVGGIVVVCLYLPNGNPQPGPKFDYKLAWMERLHQRAQYWFDSGQPVVMAGDYNVVPTDEDIYNPKSWRKDALLQPESRERYQRLLDQGWTDAVRHVFGEERVYTFWDYFRQHWERNAGLRIDHLLLNAELLPRLRSAGVDRWVRGQVKPSDHAPTWIELGPAKAAKKTAGKTAPKATKKVAKKASKKATKKTTRKVAKKTAAKRAAPARRTRRAAQ